MKGLGLQAEMGVENVVFSSYAIERAPLLVLGAQAWGDRVVRCVHGGGWVVK
jgi:hypothetical protein